MFIGIIFPINKNYLKKFTIKYQNLDDIFNIYAAKDNANKTIRIHNHIDIKFISYSNFPNFIFG